MLIYTSQEFVQTTVHSGCKEQDLQSALLCVEYSLKNTFQKTRLTKLNYFTDYDNSEQSQEAVM